MNSRYYKAMDDVAAEDRTLTSEERRNNSPLSHPCDHCQFECEDTEEALIHKEKCPNNGYNNPSDSLSKKDSCLDYTNAQNVYGSSEDNLHGYPVFRCDQCEYETFSLATLSSHQKTHNVKKLFQCDICHMKFSQAANMRRHRMRHTGIKPFECHVCLKRFFRKDHLMEHMVTHSKQLPFQCPICGKSFHRQVHLKDHISNEHAGIFLDRVCGICGYKAATAKGAKLHFTTRHARNNASKRNKSAENDVNTSMNPTSLSSTNADKHYECSSEILSGENSQHLKSIPISSSDTAASLIPLSTKSISKSESSLTPINLLNYLQNHGELPSKSNIGPVIPPAALGYPSIMSLMMDSNRSLISRMNSPLSRNHFAASIIKYQHFHGKHSNEEKDSISLMSSNDNDECVSLSNVTIKEESPNHSCSEECEDERCSSLSIDLNRDADRQTTPDNFITSAAPDSSRSCPLSSTCTDQISSGMSTSGTLSPLLACNGLRCHYCGIIYPDQTLYFLHKGLHSDTNPWKCNICGDICKDKYDFNVHILSKAHQ